LKQGINHKKPGEINPRVRFFVSDQDYCAAVLSVAVVSAGAGAGSSTTAGAASSVGTSSVASSFLAPQPTNVASAKLNAKAITAADLNFFEVNMIECGLG
jgi:hypothetical protein